MHIDLSTIVVPWDLSVTLRSGARLRLLSPLEARTPAAPRDASPRSALLADSEAVVDGSGLAALAACTIGELTAVQCVYQQAAALWWGAYSESVSKRVEPAAVDMLGMRVQRPVEGPLTGADAGDDGASDEEPIAPAPQQGTRVGNTVRGSMRLRPGGGPLPSVFGGEPWGAARSDGAAPVGFGPHGPVEVVGERESGERESGREQAPGHQGVE